jgi:hypothetical protein
MRVKEYDLNDPDNTKVISIERPPRSPKQRRSPSPGDDPDEFNDD